MRRVFTMAAAVVLLAALATPAAGAPNPQGCAGYMISEAGYSLPAGFWGEDGASHTYTISYVAPDGNGVLGSVTFSVSSSAPVYAGYVQLHFWGLVPLGPFTALHPPVINPAQQTEFYLGWVWTTDYATIGEIQAWAAATTVTFTWDGGSVTLPLGPVKSSCSGGNYTIQNDKLHVTGLFHRAY